MAAFLALASAAFYGAADFLGGIAARRASTIPVVALSQAAGLVLLLIALPLLAPASPLRSDVAWGAAAGLAGSVGVALLYHALAVGTMAIVAPTTAVCAVVIPVAAAVLLGERPDTATVVGIGLAILSIALVSQPSGADTDDTRRAGLAAPGMGAALAAGVAIGMFYLTLAQTGEDAGLWPLVAARAVSVALFGSMTILRPSSAPLAGQYGVIIAAGAVDMLANVLYLLASRAGALSTVVTLASLYPASTVLLARLVLGERLSLTQGIGIVSALAAVALIVGPRA